MRLLYALAMVAATPCRSVMAEPSRSLLRAAPRARLSLRSRARAAAADDAATPAASVAAARPLVSASLALALVNGGVIFGWPGLVGLLRHRGVALSAAEWARMYTIGSVAFSGSAPLAGASVDGLGPRVTSALAGALCVAGFGGLAVCTDAVGLACAYAALSVGGFSSYLASISIGNAKASRWHRPLLPARAGERAVTALSCLVDVSAITFVALHALQRRLLGGAWLSTRAALFGMAVVTVALHACAWRQWGRVLERRAPAAAAVEAAAASSGTAPPQPAALWPQLRSTHFAMILAFATVHSLISGHALAHLPARVALAAAGGEGGGALAELASVLMCVGCLPAIPLVSACLDRGLAFAMACVNGLGLAYVLLSLSPSLAARMVAALVFAAYRGLLYSSINIFHQQTFGPAVVGRTIGAMSLLSSLPLFLLQLPLFGGGGMFASAQQCFGVALVLLAFSTQLYATGTSFGSLGIGGIALAAAGLTPPQLPRISKAALARGDARSRELLSALTGREVAAVRSAPPDGIVGDAAVGTERLWLRATWADDAVPDAREACLFVKLPSERLWLRTFLTFPGLYANEARFYATIAPALPPSLLPRVHAAASQRTRFALVLEDLKAAGRPGGPCRLYNLTEVLPASELEPVLLALAKLHAAFWGRPHAVWSERSRPPFFPLIMRAVLAQLKATQPSALPSHAEALFRRFVERYDAVRAAWSEGPLCLAHGDAHLGNVFAARTPAGELRVGLYDWQVVSAEQPMRDVAYFLQLSADPDVLQLEERRLLRVYLRALAAELLAAPPPPGAPPHPPVPTEAEAWEGYRLHSLYSLLAFVLTSGAGDFVKDGEVVTQLSRRTVGACARLDARGALEAAIARYDGRERGKAR